MWRGRGEAIRSGNDERWIWVQEDSLQEHVSPSRFSHLSPRTHPGATVPVSIKERASRPSWQLDMNEWLFLTLLLSSLLLFPLPLLSWTKTGKWVSLVYSLPCVSSYSWLKRPKPKTGDTQRAPPHAGLLAFFHCLWFKAWYPNRGNW